jgi:hypothetical protein
MMKLYSCQTQVLAKPMTRGQYHLLQGFQLNEDSEDQGYLIVHPNGKKNHADYAGHITWTTKEVFESGGYEEVPGRGVNSTT